MARLIKHKRRNFERLEQRLPLSATPGGTDACPAATNDQQQQVAEDSSGPTLLVQLITVPEAQAARDVLLAGVSQIKAVGTPGRVAVFGEDAFGIMHDGEFQAMAAGALWGAGKVVAMGGAGYLDFAQHASTLNTGQFYRNSIEWATGVSGTGVAIVTDNSDAASWLTGQGFANVTLTSNWESSLAGAQMLIVELGDDVSLAKRSAMISFVQGGGGLFTAATGRLLASPAASEGNAALKGAGLGWADGGRDLSTSATQRSTQYANAGDALAVLANPSAFTTDQQREALIAATTAAQALPAGDPQLGQLQSALNPYTPAVGNGVSDETIQAMLQWENDKLRNSTADQVYLHRTASEWGLIDSATPRVDQSVTIAPNNAPRTVWHSTGLYAAPGEKVTVTTPGNLLSANLDVRIGSHDDSVAGRDTWVRMPRIDTAVDITSTTTEINNAYGGLVYIQVPSGSDLAPFNVQIAGAVEAPYFVLGETTNADWINSIRDRAAPYAELASENLIFSLRADVIRDLDNPHELMTFWNGIVAAQDELARVPNPRVYAERIDLDVQISNGFLHAGYPIAGVDSTGPGVVDLATLEEFGTWGYFHELGHNHQSGAWTFDGMVEVTVNIFSMYAMDSIDAIPNSGWSDMWSATRRVERHQNFLASGGDYDTAGFGDKLVIFAQLREAFGWTPYFQFFQQYIDAPAEELPTGDQQERDQWLTRFSGIVGLNLTSLFDAWDFGVSQAARDAVAHLPDWSMVELPGKHLEIATEKNTSIDTPSLLAEAFVVGGGSVAFDGFTQGKHGTVTDNGDGTLSYTPNASFTGYDQFEYTVGSSTGGAATGSVLVAVNNSIIVDTSFEPDDGFNGFITNAHSNLNMVIDNDGVRWSSNNDARIWNRADIPPDGVQVLALGLISSPTSVDIDIPGTGHGVGAVTFDYSSFSSSTDADFSLSYDANDGNGFVQAWTTHLTGQNPDWTDDTWPFVSVPINVAGDVDLRFQLTANKGVLIDSIRVSGFAANSAPNAFDDTATTDQDTAIDIALLANDLDIDAQPLSVQSFSQGTKGSVTNNGDGSLKYTPNPGAYGDDSFVYIVSDGAGGTDLAMVSVFVNPIDIVDGDVNLDSLLDEQDAAAFVLGWRSITAGLSDADKIRLGDLNLDGKTNLADAFLLNRAYEAAGMSLNMSAVFAAAAGQTTDAPLVTGVPAGSTMRGDYDLNGMIDTHDASIWRHTHGSSTILLADGNADGIVNSIDYAIWREALAAASAAPAPPANIASVEPVAEAGQSSRPAVESQELDLGFALLAKSPATVSPTAELPTAELPAATLQAAPITSLLSGAAPSEGEIDAEEALLLHLALPIAERPDGGSSSDAPKHGAARDESSSGGLGQDELAMLGDAVRP